MATIIHNGSGQIEKSVLEYERSRLEQVKKLHSDHLDAQRGYLRPTYVSSNPSYPEALDAFRRSQRLVPPELDPFRHKDRGLTSQDWAHLWNKWVDSQLQAPRPTPADQLSDFPNNQLLLLCPLP